MKNNITPGYTEHSIQRSFGQSPTHQNHKIAMQIKTNTDQQPSKCESINFPKFRRENSLNFSLTGCKCRLGISGGKFTDGSLWPHYDNTLTRRVGKTTEENRKNARVSSSPPRGSVQTDAPDNIFRLAI